jgi:hypothetical protein
MDRTGVDQYWVKDGQELRDTTCQVRENGQGVKMHAWSEDGLEQGCGMLGRKDGQGRGCTILDQNELSIHPHFLYPWGGVREKGNGLESGD